MLCNCFPTQTTHMFTASHFSNPDEGALAKSICVFQLTGTWLLSQQVCTFMFALSELEIYCGHQNLSNTLFE